MLLMRMRGWKVTAIFAKTFVLNENRLPGKDEGDFFSIWLKKFSFLLALNYLALCLKFSGFQMLQKSFNIAT